MAKVLLISTKDIKQKSVLSGNIDDNKIIQFIELAQDKHVENYLGTDLIVRLKAGITADDLSAAEVALLADYIKPMVIHWALVEIISMMPYTVTSKGAYKMTSENAETLGRDELNILIETHRDNAQTYTDKFIDYMCYNYATFPQYKSNTNNDMKPSTNTDFQGWVL